MSWDIPTARQVLGLNPGDTTHDEAIQLTMEATLDQVEVYLGRGLLFRREVVDFEYVDSYKLRLPRYPVWTVFSPSCSVIHTRVGWIELDGTGANLGDTISVDYEGGYRELPAGLERALWEAWRALYDASDDTTGLPSEDSASIAASHGGGGISKIVFPDGGSVTERAGNLYALSSESALGAVQVGTLGWLSPWGWILSTYRSESAPTLAFA